MILNKAELLEASENVDGEWYVEMCALGMRHWAFV